jgi:hypothetical protein
MDHVKLTREPFEELARSLSGIAEPLEVVFENDPHGHLLAVQVFGCVERDSDAKPPKR